MTPQAQRNRSIIAGVTLLLAGVIILPLAALGYQAAIGGAEEATITKAEAALLQTLLASQTGEFGAADNVWFVNVEGERFEVQGDAWTEPPLLSLAADVLDGQTSQTYSFDGEWLAYGTWVGGQNVALTVIDRTQELDAKRSARIRWWGTALLLPAAAALLAWFGIPRLRGPEEAAHLVNRNFIADAAHELRTPLSIIQASASHALLRERDSDAYRQALTEILNASDRTTASVGELLEFARLESGQAEPRVAPLRLDLVVEEVAASVRVDGATIVAEPGEVLVVEADYNLIRQVVDNITRNAAARAEQVWLSTSVDKNDALIQVADDGPGFDEQIIDHVFERFRRGDRSGGVGLGMAVARRIVELHGGTCDASNRTADENHPGGAVVTVRLPMHN